MNTNQTYPGALAMTNEAYHANTSHISKSGLDLIARSPLHYWAKYLDPNRVPEERKQHFITGSATHTAILEPHLLEHEYWAVNDEAVCIEIGGAKPRSTAKYKEWLANEQAKNAGKEMLSADVYQNVQRMRDAVHSHPAAAYLLSSGFVEQSIFFEEMQTGAPLKIRPDFLNTDIRWIVDVKTTDDASPAHFGKSFFNFGYHKQAAIIFDGMAQLDGTPWEGVAFIAVEKEPPYAVGVYYATPQDIQDGRSAYLGNCMTYMDCRQSNKWPAYSLEVEPITRPGWMR